MTDYEKEVLIKQTRRASLPWRGRKAKTKPQEYKQIDSPARISKCLTCGFSECVNCYVDKKKAFAILLESGMKRIEICNALSIGKQTFYNYKTELKGA